MELEGCRQPCPCISPELGASSALCKGRMKCSRAGGINQEDFILSCPCWRGLSFLSGLSHTSFLQKQVWGQILLT